MRYLIGCLRALLPMLMVALATMARTAGFRP